MKIILIVLILASLVAFGSTRPESLMSFRKLKCKIVQDNSVKCNDVTGRSCDDSKYLEVRILMHSQTCLFFGVTLHSNFRCPIC